jgi:hypothetical protein
MGYVKLNIYIYIYILINTEKSGPDLGLALEYSEVRPFDLGETFLSHI